MYLGVAMCLSSAQWDVGHCEVWQLPENLLEGKLRWPFLSWFLSASVLLEGKCIIVDHEIGVLQVRRQKETFCL